MVFRQTKGTVADAIRPLAVTVRWAEVEGLEPPTDSTWSLN